MAQIYTRRLAGIGVAPPDPVPLYEAQPDEHVIIRDAQLTTTGGAAGSILLYIAIPGLGNVYLHNLVGVPDGETVHLEMRQELKSGEQLFGQSSVGVWHVFVTGYVFR